MSKRSATTTLDFFHSSSKHPRVTDVAEKREMMTAQIQQCQTGMPDDQYMLILAYHRISLCICLDLAMMKIMIFHLVHYLTLKQHLTMHQVAQIPQGKQYLRLACITCYGNYAFL